MTTAQNSEFLLGLLLEENKHLNPIDFIDRQNKASGYSCMCVSLGVSQQFESIRNSFFLFDKFTEQYFNIYATALDNYHSIVGDTLRQVYFDEANNFYHQDVNTVPMNTLVSDATNKETAINLLETIKNDHSYAIILRDEITFTVIHYENDNFIVIDPHVEYCGILSKTGVYRYVTYDNVWNFNVYVMTPRQIIDPIELPETNLVDDETLNDPIPTISVVDTSMNS